MAACLAGVSLAFSETSAPALRLATAPFVGQTLSLELDGAVAESAVDLYFSPEAGSFPTPFGVLELRHQTLTHLASGTTSASGTWSFDMPVPLEESLAETGAHFQAIVSDPSAPAGRIVSSSVHARFLGPRVYAKYRSYRSPHRIGMYILSGVTDTIVARSDFGLTSEGPSGGGVGQPVFDVAYTRGAVMDTIQELVLFDPFFGGIEARVAFASPCSRDVFTDAHRRTVYVLELAAGGSPARVHAIELETGTETAHLDLPSTVESSWCLGDASTEVFIAEHEASGRTAIRWVGLDPLVDRGSVRVGLPSSNSFSWGPPLAYAGGQLFVSTMSAAGFYHDGNLTRCRVVSSGLTARAIDLGLWEIFRMVAVPDADRLIACWGRTDYGPAFQPCDIPITTVAGPTSFPSANGSGEFVMSDIEADGGDAWVIAPFDYGGANFLYRLDASTHAWTQYPFGWGYGPSDAEVLRDAWNHELWVSNIGYPQMNIEPEILIVDELHSSSRHIALQHTAEVMRAVPLP
jgi:hypothetical protein